MPHKRAFAVIVAALATAMVVGAAGCGDTDSGGSNSNAAPKAAYRSRVAACLEELGYDLRSAGNATRVSSPNGSAIANLQFFASQAQARKFHRRLAVDGAYGDRAVAVFLNGLRSDSDKRVVADCLTP